MAVGTVAGYAIGLRPKYLVWPGGRRGERDKQCASETLDKATVLAHLIFLPLDLRSSLGSLSRKNFLSLQEEFSLEKTSQNRMH